MFVLCNCAVPLDGSVKPEKHEDVEVLQYNFDSNKVCEHLLGYNVTIFSHISLSSDEWKTEYLK